MSLWQTVAYGAQDVYLRANGTYGSPYNGSADPYNMPRRTALGTINIYDATMNPTISFQSRREKKQKEVYKVYNIDDTECNVCYETLKVAKCQHCAFHLCQSCYDKIGVNKCTHCKNDFFGVCES